jgi:transposase
MASMKSGKLEVAKPVYLSSKETMIMRCYEQQHRFYCGVDLHARSMYVCILDHHGQVLFHDDLPADPQRFLEVLQPFRQDVVVACECMFAWYWLADLCSEQEIPFVLGHALYMKAIHGAKTKNDKIDAHKIAKLLRGGNLPLAYVYPRGLRETRDLLRRRMYLVHQRAAAMAHVQNTNSQYNLPPFSKKIDRASNRQELQIPKRFADERVQKTMEVDLELLDHLDGQIKRLEWYLQKTARVQDGNTLLRLRSIPGVGPILSLVLLYEIHDIGRFAQVGQFLSYCRLVRPRHESAGKTKTGIGKKKIGNPHLRWAFAEAVLLMLREDERAKKYKARLEKKHGKAKALGIVAAKLARAVYFVLRKEEVFDADKFFAG